MINQGTPHMSSQKSHVECAGACEYGNAYPMV